LGVIHSTNATPTGMRTAQQSLLSDSSSSSSSSDEQEAPTFKKQKKRQQKNDLTKKVADPNSRYKGEIEWKSHRKTGVAKEPWELSIMYRWLAAYCWDRPNMPLADTMLLSPWQKWQKYNRVPWKVFLHSLIFIVVTVQVLLVYVETSQYTRATHNTFEHLFLGEKEADVTKIFLYTMEEFFETLNNTVETYYNINQLAVDMFMQRHLDMNSLGDVNPILMITTLYKDNFFLFENDTWDIQANNLDQIDVVSNLTKDYPLGPFGGQDEESLQSMFQRLVKVRLSFNFINVDIGVLGPIPFLWSVVMLYAKVGGRISLRLLLDKQTFYTDSLGLETQNIFTVFNVLVFSLNAISFLFAVRSLFTNIVIFRKVKRTYLAIPQQVMKDENYPLWSRIPFSVKFEFFSLWTIHVMVTSLSLMIASVLGLIEEFGHRTSMAFSVFEAIGALGASVTILRYLEYYEHFYTLILTLKLAGLRITRFIISAFPIFFGYMLMGVVLFSPYSVRFKDLNFTSITLFALLNGDDIRDSFEQLNQNYPYPLVPTIYLYSFIALFITAILNIFIFIIEDSYHAAKYSRRSQHKPGDPLHPASRHIHSGPQRGSQFDIFALFRIIDREYNVNDEDYAEMDTVTDSTSSSSSEGISKQKKMDQTSKKKKKHHKPKTSSTDSEDDRDPSSCGASSVLSINDSHSPRHNLATLLQDSLGVAAQTVVRASSSRIYDEPSRPRMASKDFQELGYLRPGDTTAYFKPRITCKKLKRDLNQIVLDQMEQFQEELSAQMALLQAKHTARLKKRTNAQILKAFEHMVPQGFADSSVRESPF